MNIWCSDDVVLSYPFVNSFSLEKTLFCGQSFRWVRGGVMEPGISGMYTGEVHRQGCSADVILTLKALGENDIHVSTTSLEFRSFWAGYFDLDTDYSLLNKFAVDDEFFKKCLDFGCGLRVLRQDFWEMLCTFILTQRSSIAKTTGTISRLVTLCSRGGELRSFPSPGELLEIDVKDLERETGCGYRGRYLHSAAHFICNGVDGDLAHKGYEVQKRTLMQICGVGTKVADCVILFGLHNRAVYPVDIWIQRVITRMYNGHLNYEKYGDLAGVVQQYVYYYALHHARELV